MGIRIHGTSKGMMLAVLVSVALALGCQPRKVQVPDVVGLMQAAAEQTIRDAKLSVGGITQEYNADVPEGAVIRQMPEAGASVPRGSSVDLVVSLGPEDEPLPDPDPEGEGEAPGEGEVPVEGEGELEGEPAEGEGEGEPGEGELPGEGEGEAPAEGEGEAEEEPAPPAEPPSANFNVEPQSGPWPLVVTFTDLSEDGSVPIDAWLWDFGDGHMRLDQHTEHVYREPGVYSVSLTVYSDAGEDTFTVVDHVTVEEALDTDGDGIPDWLEQEIGTDPNKWDTSGDGLSDGALYYTGMNPLETHGTLAPEAVITETHPELRLIEVGEGYLVFEAPPDKMELLAPGRILVNSSFEYEYVDKDGFLARGFGFIRRTGESIVDGVRIIVVAVDEAIQSVWPELEWEGHIPLTLDSTGTPLQTYLHNYPAYDDGTLSVHIWNGRILLTPTLSYRLDIQGGTVKEFSTILSGNVLLELGAKVEVTSAYSWPFELTLVKVPFPIASTPVVVTLSADVGFEASIQGQAGVYAGFKSRSYMEVGAIYEDGTMRSQSTLNIGREFMGPEFDISASFEAKVFLKPKVDISLYGRGGAYAQLRPFLAYDAHLPCPPEPKLDLGLDAQVGIYADLFLWDWTPDPLTLAEVRHTLWRGGCWYIHTDPNQARAPVIAPYTNTGWTAYAISLSSATPDATIRYTLNSVDPTEASLLYNRPFVIRGEPDEQITVKARAWKDGLTPSAVSACVYTFGETGVGEEHIVMLPGDVPLAMVSIPAGTFMMGSPDDERGRLTREGPQHQVTLTQNYYLGKYPVTQAQWLAVMGSWPESSPSSSYGVGDDNPAYYVSWYDAQNFISALNSHITSTGQGAPTFRLPTEAEWEYACRAGTTTRFYFGDSLDVNDACEDDGVRSQYMWYCGNKSPYGNKPVGQKLPNAFGLYDMHGNIWEWCQDWYGSYATGPVMDPTGPTSGSFRVIRGGRWDNDAKSCRSADRRNPAPVSRINGIGFRLARS